MAQQPTAASVSRHLFISEELVHDLFKRGVFKSCDLAECRAAFIQWLQSERNAKTNQDFRLAKNNYEELRLKQQSGEKIERGEAALILERLRTILVLGHSGVFSQAMPRENLPDYLKARALSEDAAKQALAAFDETVDEWMSADERRAAAAARDASIQREFDLTDAEMKLLKDKVAEDLADIGAEVEVKTRAAQWSTGRGKPPVQRGK